MKTTHRNLGTVGTSAAFFFALGLLANPAFAKLAYLKQFKEMYPSARALHSCVACHDSVPKLNPYGLDYGKFARDLKALEPLDSDGDTYTNLVEIQAQTFPGNKDSNSAPTR